MAGTVRHAGRVPERKQIQVRRAADRFITRTDGIESRHAFSFGTHYDPDNVRHGQLVVLNDDLLAPGAGYDTHTHQDTEIVTWVLAGRLAHGDSAGHAGVVRPGLVQRLSAGRGVQHSERNASVPGDPTAEPVHFVQMWLPPDQLELEPTYQQLDVSTALDAGGLVTVASGLPRDAALPAVPINNRHSALHVARLHPGDAVTVPEAPYVHLYVARGAVTVEGIGPLAAGDAVRLTGTGGQLVTGAEPATEVLVWEMHA